MPQPLSQLLQALAWVAFVEAMALSALAAGALAAGRPMRPLDLAPARVLALLGSALIVWLGRSDPAAAALSALVLCAIVALASRRALPDPDATEIPPGQPRDWLVAEASYLLPFVLLLAIRGLVPAIEGAEKFPDFAFFNAMPLASSYPAPDPWLSGHAINYYSFGHLALALPGFWIGVKPEVSYNIALAFVGAAAFAAFASLLRKLTGGWIWAAVGGYLLVFAGNLDGLRQLTESGGIRQFDYWRSSRVIPDAIDEFPFFSLLHGDLHAHLIALLPQILMLTACATLARPGRRAAWPPSRSLLLSAFALGSGWATNEWDVPILTALLLGSLLTAAWHSRGPTPLPLAAARAVVEGLTAIALAYTLFLPFHLSYRPPVEGMSFYEGASPLGAYLIHFSPLLLPAASLFGAEVLRRATAPGAQRAEKAAALVTGAVAAALVVFVLTRRPVLALNVPLLALALFVGSKREDRAFPALVLSIALVFLGLCEIAYVKDPYQPPLERMNTVFKITWTAWPLLAAAAALALHGLDEEAGRPLGWLPLGIALALLPATLPYPLLAPGAAAARSGRAPWSLDGLAYLARSRPDDYVAIQWLRHIARDCPDAVLVEATGDPYSIHARLASFSGVPAVLGWANHEMVWRGAEATQEILDRQEDIARIYESGDPGVVGPLLDRYRISLVAIGSVERTDYPAASLTSLERMLPSAFRSGGLTILAVPGRACP